VAGIFNNMLPSALMWQVVGKRAASAKSGSSRIYRAPSWSWTSKDMPILFNMAGDSKRSIAYRIGITIEKIQLDLVDPSILFGRLQSASLTVKGRPVTVVAKRFWKRRDRWGNGEDREDGDGDGKEDVDETRMTLGPRLFLRFQACRPQGLI
jgi:hypothetical protein